MALSCSCFVSLAIVVKSLCGQDCREKQRSHSPKATRCPFKAGGFRGAGDKRHLSLGFHNRIGGQQESSLRCVHAPALPSPSLSATGALLSQELPYPET